MPIPKRNAVLSFLSFATVLCLALIFRSQDLKLLLPKKFGEGEYGDVIGIDVSGHDARVGIYRDGKFEIIPDKQGRTMIPSYVGFTGSGKSLVGYAARDQAESNPQNTIYDVIQLIGRSFADPEFQDDIRDLAYNVVERDGKPYIKVQIKGEDKSFSPGEVSSKLLETLKAMAETYLHRIVKNAIIVVPSYFADEQKQNIKEAAMMAGLDPLRIFNAPKAAVLGYFADSGMNDTDADSMELCNYIVYDLGERESNVAIIDTEAGIVIEVLEMARDKNLGGDDFENALLNQVIAQFNKKNTITISEDLTAMENLKYEVRRAEQILLTEPSTKIEFPASGKFNHFSMTVTQTQIQNLHKELAQRALNLVKQAMRNVKLETAEINNIIFTGNPKNFAKLQPFVEAYFDGKKALMYEGVNPEEVFVRGAAMIGERFSNSDFNVGPGMLMVVAAVSVGIETSGNIFTPIIPRNTVLPTRRSMNFSTTTDRQTKVEIKIFMGERLVVSENKHIGTLVLKGLPPKPRGEAEIEIVFELDEEEELTVYARDKERGKEKKLVIPSRNRQLTMEDIEAMLIASENYREADEAQVEKAQLAIKDKINYKGSKYGLVVKEVDLDL